MPRRFGRTLTQCTKTVPPPCLASSIQAQALAMSGLSGSFPSSRMSIRSSTLIRPAADSAASVLLPIWPYIGSQSTGHDMSDSPTDTTCVIPRAWSMAALPACSLAVSPFLRLTGGKTHRLPKYKKSKIRLGNPSNLLSSNQIFAALLSAVPPLSSVRSICLATSTVCC
jgi:hypothetical protein